MYDIIYNALYDIGLSDIIHLTSSIWHHPSDIIHMTSSIWHHPSDIIHLTSSIWHHPSDIIHMTSSIWHHPSDIIHLTSSIWYHPIWHHPSDIFRAGSILIALVHQSSYHLTDDNSDRPRYSSDRPIFWRLFSFL